MKRLFSLLFPLLLAADASARPASFDAAISVLGQPSFEGDSVVEPPTASSINSPEGLAIDPTTGKLFVADSENHRILRFSSTDAYRTNAPAEAVFGQPDFGSNEPNRGQPNPAANTLNYPATLAIDPQGRLWVTDCDNARVLRYDGASAKPRFGAVADAVIGQPSFASATRATNSADPAGFSRPTGVTVDGEGRLWVSDEDFSRILRFDAAASLPNAYVGVASGYFGFVDGGVFVPGTSNVAFGAAVGGLSAGADGELWIADPSNNRVLRFDDAANKPDGGPADGVLGQAGFDSSDSNGPAADSMFQPYHVTLAPDGTLWVSDYGHNRVLGFLAAADKGDGAAADIVLGQVNFTTVDPNLPANRSTPSPTQVAIGAQGSLLVGEYDAVGKVRRWSDPVGLVAPRTARANRAGVANLRGRASGATVVEYRVPGQGGFKRARGSVRSWKVRVSRLKRALTPVSVRARAFDGRTAAKRVRVAKSGAPRRR